MRCSSCETLLDEFVDGTLAPPRAAAVAAHLRTCLPCQDLHQRLRIVDGLLATARAPELPRDFTFDVMVAIRTLPAPAVARRPLLVYAGLYLAAAWIVVAAAFAFLRPSIANALRELSHAAGNTAGLLAQGAHALLPVTPIALPLIVTVLCVDAMLFAIVIVFYRAVRPRLHAHLAAVPVERR